MLLISEFFSRDCEFKQVPIPFKVFGIYRRRHAFLSHHTFNAVVGRCVCGKNLFWFWREVSVSTVTKPVVLPVPVVTCAESVEWIPDLLPCLALPIVLLAQSWASQSPLL